MKVLKRSQSELIVGVRELSVRHWGLFMFILAGGGMTAILASGGDLPLGPRVGFLAAASLGLLAALFSGKNLTHRLDKTTGTLTVEFPVRLDTGLEISQYRLSDIRSIKKTQQNSWQQALTNSTDVPGGKIGYASSGFSYVLKDGTEVESGIFTSETEKMGKVIEALAGFLSVPVE